MRFDARGPESFTLCRPLLVRLSDSVRVASYADETRQDFRGDPCLIGQVKHPSEDLLVGPAAIECNWILASDIEHDVVAFHGYQSLHFFFFGQYLFSQVFHIEHVILLYASRVNRLHRLHHDLLPRVGVPA